MPSADLFLQLLEEKDLVSTEVLQAARREFQRSSSPVDAFQISLWLVQGHHITASQAERLMAAATERADDPEPKSRLPIAFQSKSLDRRRGAADEAEKPSIRGFQSKFPQPPTPAANRSTEPDLDLELTTLTEDRSTSAKPAKPSPAP